MGFAPSHSRSGDIYVSRHSAMLGNSSRLHAQAVLRCWHPAGDVVVRSLQDVEAKDGASGGVDTEGRTQRCIY